MKKLAILLVGVVLLTACGGGGSSTSTASTTSVGTAANAGLTATTTTSASPAAATSAATPVAAATTSSQSATTVATPAATASAVAATAAVMTPSATSAPTTSAPITTPVPTQAPTEAATAAATTAPTQQASAGQPTQDQLNGALLVLSDMPAGWTAVPSDPSTNGEPVGFCKPDAQSGIKQIRVNGAFQDSDKGLYLQETLAGFAPGDSVAWMNWLKPMVDCGQITDNSVNPPASYAVKPLDIAAVGDQMLAYRLSISDAKLGNIAYDIAYSRVGNCVVAVANLALGVANSDLTQSALKTAVDRARPVCG